MADVSKKAVVRAEKCGRNVVSYTLEDGTILSADEMKDLLLAGESIEGVRLQKSQGKVWVRLHPLIPVTSGALVVTARNRALQKRQNDRDLLAKGIAEEVAELICLAE